jgi:hypothetical protein
MSRRCETDRRGVSLFKNAADSEDSGADECSAGLGGVVGCE